VIGGQKPACVNHAVCRQTAAGRGQFCWKCTLFGQCHRIQELAASDFCAVCRQPGCRLVAGPWCSRHGVCGACYRRYAFGLARKPAYGRLATWVVAHHQRLRGVTCPQCRGADDRTAAARLDAVIVSGCGGWPGLVCQTLLMSQAANDPG